MRALVAAAVAALAFPAIASAHATLLKTAPANGAVVAKAPRQVTVTFDDTVRVAAGTAAVDNATGQSVLGSGAHAHGRVLTIPLAALRNGAYSVRWSIVSEDGHREEGVLAFAVGAGGAAPRPVLGAGVPLTWNDILLRTLYYLGVLTAAGAAVFWLLTRRLLGAAVARPIAHLLFLSLLFAFLGGSGIVHAAPPGTRYALVLKIAVTLALAGGAAAALAPTIPSLLAAAAAAALLLAAAPTLSGHSLDRDQPHVLSIAADFAHLLGAAVWLGGLVALVWVVPRATEDDAIRAAAARRFSTAALVSVVVIAVTGILRALTELSAVSQVWSTSYGRALIVKTAVFVPLLGVGWLNRTLLLSIFSRLRRSARIEIVAILAIVVAVAILTELRPGKEAPRAVAATAPLAAALPPVLPPADAVVDAHELGALGVAVARTPNETTVTILGPDGTGDDGRTVRVDGVRAEPCGSGCYRAASAAAGALSVTVDGREAAFLAPAQAPGAARLLRAVTRRVRASRTIVFQETLRSTPTNAQVTRFTVVAPNRLAYVTRGGPSAIVIGARRWDRSGPHAPWLPSQQTPLDVTQPYWTSPTNVHLVAPNELTFLDRSIPAWFRLTLRNGRPTDLRMTAAAHFMHDRYVGFDVPATVSPPSR
ncbi:MAG TPA: copper resistance protein CopC [Gaiellaceae bacterium]